MINKNFIIISLLLLVTLNTVSAYYIGWDYGVNVTKYKNMLNLFKIESFENLNNIYFTNAECVWEHWERIDDNTKSGFCSSGIFKYWYNGRTSIIISAKTSDDIVLLIIAHELGHLQQYNQQEYEFSQDIADEYAMLLFK